MRVAIRALRDLPRAPEDGPQVGGLPAVQYPRTMLVSAPKRVLQTVSEQPVCSVVCAQMCR